MQHVVSTPLEPSSSHLPIPLTEATGSAPLPARPTPKHLAVPGSGIALVQLSHGPTAQELVSLPSVNRVSPSRPFGHTGKWTSAWFEVWIAWLSLFAHWCGLSSSQQGW